ncbi:MAG: HAMP domain-containing histidine kinase [Deltaproteobacteria bacterium]|jgi:signal transduction histidine kinase|nr:HAMP domain-containing histidine kinase [Deltaproteobacteria bacterium]MBT4067468.1 HAMP domain-containing histidine kinase [Candidatus Neomarinimicrobiota bacterium]MBT5176834.1 HAMP domain-containing histidine kinase [Candidatus Neomarinimicrobiota bacterium]
MIVTTALVWQTYENLRRDIFRNAVEVGAALSGTLQLSLKHDDVWRAYRLLADTGQAADRDGGLLLVVLDEEYKVFASNQPRQFPVLASLENLNPEFASLNKSLLQNNNNEARPIVQGATLWMYVVHPIHEYGARLGVLLIGYAHSQFLPRYYEIVWNVSISSLGVMLILLPLGWYLGKNMAEPLVELSNCMAMVGQIPPDEIEYNLKDADDEIGLLSTRFREMLEDLRIKQQFERQVLVSERLAAIGRMSAGVAHEINNPLGGMLNAINTFKQHRHEEGVPEKTLYLLERGLGQIQETVSALLVESIPESHPLSFQDVEDIRTLLHADINKKNINLVWENNLATPVSLPSTQIRQILMNLCLNALQAAPQESTVFCKVCAVEDENLLITVRNEGGNLDDESMELLFEPFAHNNTGGIGLGLWVTYQIVRQLGGEIVVNNQDGTVSFSVGISLNNP